jgi:hypothetical protein
MQHIQLDIWHTSEALFFKPDYIRVQQRLIGQLPSHNLEAKPKYVSW